MSYKYSVQNITFYKADWWTASDVYGLWHYHDLSNCFYVDKKLHCSITLSPTLYTIAEVNPEADGVYTSTTTELLYLDKDDIIGNTIYFPRYIAERGTITLRHLHSERGKICVPAFCLMTVRWHPAWRQKNSDELMEEVLLVSAAVTLIFHLSHHAAPWGRKAFLSEWRDSKPIKCLSRQRCHSLKWPFTCREL